MSAKRECAQCHTSFLSPYGGARYCSEECRVVGQREANRARVLRYKAAHPERVKQQNKEQYRRYQEKHKDEIRERKRVYRQRSKEAERARYWANLEESRARKAKTQRRRRARKRGASAFLVTPRDLRRLLFRYNGCCAYCGISVVNTVQWDHAIPLARGGQDSIGNLVPACGPCNRRKHAKLPIEFRRILTRTRSGLAA